MTQPMKNPQTVLQFWATVFVGQFGAGAFEDLTSGNAGAHRGEMREALALVEAVWELTDDDATFIDQVTASERFVDRESVFFNQGDWMAGAFADVTDFEYGRDWGRVNFPGTDGVYMLGIDLVASPATAEFDAPARAFLEFLGSREGLEVLNRVKGSIPPRTDVDMDDYPQFLREQHRDFTRADHFPAGHALEVTPDVFIEARTAMSEFLTTRDVDATVDRLVDAY
jgi:glucose/mannose transport system substrate-binding protein